MTDAPFLVTEKGEEMTRNYLSKFIMKTFEETKKSIAVTMLRHIFLSHRFKDESSIAEKQELARLMGHSVSVQQNTYVKKTIKIHE